MIKTSLFMKNQKGFSGQIIINFFVESFYLLAIFLTPLFFSVFLETENVFELNKIFLLRILLVLVFSLTIFREIFFPSNIFSEYTKFFKKYWLWPTLFVLALGLSLLFSSDIVYSFFGSIDRQLGYLSYLLFLAWFLLFSFNLLIYKQEGKLKGAVRRVLLAILLSAFFVALYGVLQFFGIDYYSWTEPAIITGRAFSTLGQPNFFASWLLLVLPLAFWFFYQEKKKIKKYFYLLTFLLIFLGTIFSSSRSALLAILVLVFIITLYVLFSFSKKLSFKKILAILLLFLFVLFSSLFLLEKTVPGRVKSFIDFSSGSISARFNFYETAILGIKDKPLFGHGQENSYQSFISHYNPQWIIHSGVDSTPDRAHSLVLDILLMQGLFGLLVYTLFYFYLFSLFWKNLKRRGFKDPSLPLGLGLFVYIFSLLFNFAVVCTEFYLFVFLALLSVISFDIDSERDNDGAEKSEITKGLSYEGAEVNKIVKKNKFLRLGVLFISMVLSFFVIFLATNELLADYYFLGAKEKFNQGEFSESLIFLEYIDDLKINPVSRSFYNERSASWILNIYPFKEEIVLNSFLTERLKTSLKNIQERQPQDVLARAQILNVLGEQETANLLIYNFRQINPLYLRAITIEAKMMTWQGNDERALGLYDFLISILPDLNNEKINQEHENSLRDLRKRTFIASADIYSKQKNYELAEKYYRLAYLENPLDYSLLKVVADNLYLQKDFTQALVEVKKGLRLSPSDYNWPLLAHYLYEELGEEALALNFYQQAINLGYIEKK